MVGNHDPEYIEPPVLAPGLHGNSAACGTFTAMRFMSSDGYERCPSCYWQHRKKVDSVAAETAAMNRSVDLCTAGKPSQAPA